MFPKVRGTILGVPVIRTIVFWGLDWGRFILGNYQISLGGLGLSLNEAYIVPNVQKDYLPRAIWSLRVRATPQIWGTGCCHRLDCSDVKPQTLNPKP